MKNLQGHYFSIAKKDKTDFGKFTYILPRRQKDYPVDFDDELRIGDVRYKHLTQITITVQLFWRLPYET